jgi:hypothetical protein
MWMAALPGCDDVYTYIVFPPARTEYTLVPDEELLNNSDSANVIRLSDDKLTIIYDTKDYKIELKYLTDYHLNTFEFSDQSQSEQYSTNPFTYANWIDPDLGYTPNRFTVFKVTIYNYAGGKINFDPENAFLKTDRGDEFFSYGREEKNSRYQSLEGYFKKRKGTSGIDDDVFESRMGTIRRTVHYLGKPVFRGDVRDGLIVFDPLDDEVERIRVSFKDFILGYDENNQAAEFTSMDFYFRRTLFELPKNALQLKAARDSMKEKSAIPLLEPSARPSGEVNIAVKTTNTIPAADLMKPLEEYFSEYTNFKTSYMKTPILASDMQKSNILMIIADEGRLVFTEEQEKLGAEMIKRGGFIIADERSTNIQSENWSAINNYITNISFLLGTNVSIGRVPSDHPIYMAWKRFSELPPVDGELLNVEGRLVNDFLVGLFHENRLVAVLSNRGYSIAWGEFNTAEIRSGKDFTRQRELISNILYYALVSAKK